MTEKDVIDFFSKLPNRIPLKSLTDEYVEMYDNANSIMRNALRKRISEQPISHMLGDFSYIYYCKDCNNSVCKGDNYCRICGQKLDWS